MNDIEKYAYQKDLIFASLDDISPISIVPLLHGGVDGFEAKKWKEAVIDFIFKNLTSDLIKPLHLKNKTTMEIVEIFEKVEPTEVNSSIDWIATYFVGTEKLKLLLKKYNMMDWSHYNDPLNDALMDEVVALYELS